MKLPSVHALLSRLPDAGNSRPLKRAGRRCPYFAALAAGALLVAGCVSPNFQPKSQARRDVYEPGQTDAPPMSAEFVNANPSATGYGIEGVEHPANQVLATDLDLPFIRANRAPGVNVFGEFPGQGVRPYLGTSGKAGFRQHTYVDEGFDADVAVDSTGQWMVFASTRHSIHSDIYLQRTDGLAVTKLTSDPGDDAFPVFSPDGRRIAFASNRTGNWGIYVMDANGQNVTAVTTMPTQELHPSFSPDGQRLVYCSIGGRSGQWELWVADLTSGQRTMIGFGLFPDWSPRTDKDVIAFQRARQRGGRWFSLWTLDLINGEPLDVTEVAVSSNAALVAPAWSPDGTQLAFAAVVEPESTESDSTDSRVMAGRQDIWTVNADGSERHRLTDGKGVYATPFWASDGRIYFICDRGGTEAIWSTRADGPNYSEAAIDVGPVGQ